LFVEESFKKHFLACERVFLKLRPEFVSLKQRISDPDRRLQLQKAQYTITFYQNPKLNNNWRRECKKWRHKVFEWKRGGVLEEEKGQDKPEDTEERLQCAFCGRKFIQDALNRHKPICERNYSKKQVRVSKA
jgi:hypothetical protein